MSYPTFMDLEDKINQLNHFPKQLSYQCFLLDKDNKVVTIGNPTLNLAIWELYKEHISGEKVNKENTNTTTIEADQTKYDFGNILIGLSSYLYNVCTTLN